MAPLFTLKLTAAGRERAEMMKPELVFRELAVVAVLPGPSEKLPIWHAVATHQNGARRLVRLDGMEVQIVCGYSARDYYEVE